MIARRSNFAPRSSNLHFVRGDELGYGCEETRDGRDNGIYLLVKISESVLFFLRTIMSIPAVELGGKAGKGFGAAFGSRHMSQIPNLPEEANLL
jgi:hypothetical protein